MDAGTRTIITDLLKLSYDAQVRDTQSVLFSTSEISFNSICPPAGLGEDSLAACSTRGNWKALANGFDRALAQTAYPPSAHWRLSFEARAVPCSTFPFRKLSPEPGLQLQTSPVLALCRFLATASNSRKIATTLACQRAASRCLYPPLSVPHFSIVHLHLRHSLPSSLLHFSPLPKTLSFLALVLTLPLFTYS